MGEAIKFGHIVGIVLLLAAFSLPSYAYVDTVLNKAEPSQLTVDTSGNKQKVNLYGDGFEDMGHPNRDEYMHWQIRRDDGEWMRCSRLSSVNPDCFTTGWTGGMETLVIGGNYISRAGYIELRLFHGLALEDAMGPDQVQPNWSWSNVLRIPVVVHSTVSPASASTPVNKLQVSPNKKLLNNHLNLK